MKSNTMWNTASIKLFCFLSKSFREEEEGEHYVK